LIGPPRQTTSRLVVARAQQILGEIREAPGAAVLNGSGPVKSIAANPSRAEFNRWAFVRFWD
jgi:hypothetical protein